MWEWPTIYYYIPCQPSKMSVTQAQIPCQHCRLLVDISKAITRDLRQSKLLQEEALLKATYTFHYWDGLAPVMTCNLKLLVSWVPPSCFKKHAVLLVMFIVFAAKQQCCRWHTYGDNVEMLTRNWWHQTMPHSFYHLWFCKIFLHFNNKKHYSECCIFFL